ncbi:hypothetical protein [Methylophaga sp. OBS3]|uniref:hypothetical protein n=1 Tax=Methylophaga sp. OBS3 TaxID=2991934 RepID=UPI002252D763|nr:hypothetical protein [Methylophaga sp. OBS3]MCX4189126.1 hypothetical protein [Methylophaga sp. OBS3]
MRVWVLCWMLALSAHVYADETANLVDGQQATINVDRSWGLLIGDEITAEVTLPESLSINPDSLPQRNKRHGAWLYLRDSELSDNKILMHYQVFNVPAENREVATPVFEIRTTDGGFVSIPATPIKLGSFLASENADANGRFVPRGDMILQPFNDAKLYQQLKLALLLLIISTTIWLAWHFGFRPRKRLPFAHAVFELNKMRWLGRKDTDAASRSLHHAFNQSAGTVLVASRLEKLWQQCPWLTPVKADIESFYRQSAAHYFSATGGEAKNFGQLLSLARACRAQEKMA